MSNIKQVADDIYPIIAEVATRCHLDMGELLTEVLAKHSLIVEREKRIRLANDVRSGLRIVS